MIEQDSFPQYKITFVCNCEQEFICEQGIRSHALKEHRITISSFRAEFNISSEIYYIEEVEFETTHQPSAPQQKFLSSEKSAVKHVPSLQFEEMKEIEVNKANDLSSQPVKILKKRGRKPKNCQQIVKSQSKVIPIRQEDKQQTPTPQKPEDLYLPLQRKPKVARKLKSATIEAKPIYSAAKAPKKQWIYSFSKLCVFYELPKSDFTQLVQPRGKSKLAVAISKYILCWRMTLETLDKNRVYSTRNSLIILSTLLICEPIFLNLKLLLELHVNNYAPFFNYFLTNFLPWCASDEETHNWIETFQAQILTRRHEVYNQIRGFLRWCRRNNQLSEVHKNPIINLGPVFQAQLKMTEERQSKQKQLSIE